MENDGTVEKAEAFTKELEDVMKSEQFHFHIEYLLGFLGFMLNFWYLRLGIVLHFWQMRNMLKKKQEEAKDLLLRAIVNNNKLLMLNHPMFAHKISFQLMFFRIL